MTDVYDPEDGGSPPLKPQEVNYQPQVDLPPFAINETLSSDTTGSTGSPKDKATPPNGPRQNSKPDSGVANSVLIRSLAPNRPDIAEYETHNATKPGHFFEDERPLKRPDWKPKSDPIDQSPPQPGPHIAVQTAANALSLLISRESPEPEQKQSLNAPPVSPKNHQKQSSQDNKPKSPVQKPFGNPFHELPPILQSPPQTTSPHSPQNNQNLPSIQSALGGFPVIPSKEPPARVNGASSYSFQPVQGSSPSLSRNDLVRERPPHPQPPTPAQYPTPQIPPSPYSSYLSPASSKDMSAVSSPASQAPPYPRKSDISYVTTAFEISPQSTQSPATGYPTPIDQPTGPCERPYTANTPSSGPIPTGTFKCRHPGCTAPPFQTQYLLNSHANVHSQDRPHFCPVEGCPRGAGGKGFKRKNEMIRHGLVHNSPGYVCPFCPDQQHKYPRPDNLQRHVRVHHVDKNKDDPELRHVLSQRPEGSTRGRRRRTNT